MGEAGEGAEVFKNLFGGFSGSLSLFTNNPFQRGNTADAPCLSQPELNGKGDSREPLKKGKKLAGKEESKEAQTEPSVHPAEKRKTKKKNENTVEFDNGAPDLKGKSQDVAEEKKKRLVADDTRGSNVNLKNAPSNAAKQLSIVNKEKDKRSKRKVVEEEIQEDFEKKFRGSDGKKAKSEAYVQGVHSEDPEIDNILHESLQEENKVCSGKSCSCAFSFLKNEFLFSFSQLTVSFLK